MMMSLITSQLYQMKAGALAKQDCQSWGIFLFIHWQPGMFVSCYFYALGVVVCSPVSGLSEFQPEEVNLKRAQAQTKLGKVWLESSCDVPRLSGGGGLQSLWAVGDGRKINKEERWRSPLRWELRWSETIWDMVPKGTWQFNTICSPLRNSVSLFYDISQTSCSDTAAQSTHKKRPPIFDLCLLADALGP